MQAVSRSGDLRRVLALPRREWLERSSQLAEELSQALRTPAGSQHLRPVQAAMLAEAYEQRGLLGPVGVGHGKTIVSVLAPTVIPCERPLLLVPAALREQTLRQVLPELRQHWQLHPALKVRSYSELSTASKADLLDELQPDLVVADEAHHLKRRSAARTRRFLRYFREHPSTILVALSGTITKDSLLDYQHLALLALREDAPVPKSWSTCTAWDDALAVRDEKPNAYQRRLAPGALLDFCEPGEIEHAAMRPEDAQTLARQGYRRRLVQTPGVVATTGQAVPNSLVVLERPLRLPTQIAQALAVLDARWVTPGGEEVDDPMRLAAHAKELAAGFYYLWDWPASVDAKARACWLQARADWHRYVRDQLRRRVAGLDSPLQVANAVHAGELPEGAPVLAAWQQVEAIGQPPTLPRWLSWYLVEDALAWANRKDQPGIVWVFHDAVGQLLEQRGLRYFGAGRDREVLELDGTRSVALSAAAHGTGKNLQAYERALLTSCPSSALQWEQLLGRLHRIGQRADEVTIEVYLHTQHLREALEGAVEEARYVQSTTGLEQKLLFARVVRA